MIIESISSQITSIISLMRANFLEALSLVGILWIIHIVNVILQYRLNVFGIYPRHPLGLIGIPFFSFLHASFNHIFFNSIPLVILADLILLSGKQNFINVTTCIILISGFTIWLLGRRALHVGASSLIMGYWGYLLVSAWHTPSVITYAVMFLCIYYFGGLVGSFFPTEERVSWEGHIIGFLAGVATLYLYPFTIIQ